MSALLLGICLFAGVPDLPVPPVPASVPRAVGTDWGSMSPLLRIRPFELSTLPDAVRDTVQAGVGQSSIDGVRLAVVVDTPDTVGVVSQATARAWKRSDVEVLAVARAHTRAALQTDLQRFDEAFPSLGDTTIQGQLWTGGDTIAVLSDPGTFLDPAPHGALLVAPTREMVLVHRLSPTVSLEAALATFAALALMDGPPGQEAFSTRLFWWSDGELRVLDVEDPADARPRVSPGPALDALREQRAATPIPAPHGPGSEG